ncbi:MAG: hypothetical protein KC620_08760 [Myxococcales bacterium]|nr:hypothetical protein [Myxococcales bacterium]
MNARLASFALLIVCCAAPAFAQYGGPPKMGGAGASGGLPPFLASMKRHDVKVAVQVKTADGALTPAPAGVAVGFRILAGGSKVRDYHETTDDTGAAVFPGIPSNPEVQGAINYEVWADHRGVRFPYQLQGVPGEGSSVDLVIYDVTTDYSTVSLDHAIEVFPDEESLVARHTIRLFNDGPLAVNLGALPGGGLLLPCPQGAKHPELHDEHDPLVEVRGTDIVYKGALLPTGVGEPAEINVIYTLPYAHEVLEWNQTMPVATRGAMVVVPQHKQPEQQEALPLRIETRGAYGAVRNIEQEGDRLYEMLTAGESTLAAGEPLRFAIAGLPAESHAARWALIIAILAVIGGVLFGYRRPAGSGARMSRTHLVEERDRLVRALARMRRAVAKGRMTEARFEREREAITARLVSLFKAIDRVDPR